jgi:Tol biopolymer transport system component
MGARDSSQRVLSLATALSPDGRLITYTVEQLLRSGSSWTEGPTYAYLAQADGSAGSGTILPKYPAHETTPIFSPDSRWLAMYTGEMAWANGDGELWVMGTTSGDVRRVADGIKPGFDGGAWLDWSPDAQKLIYNSNTSDRGLYMVNRDGTGRQRFEDGAYPIWSPDGKKIAYIGGATIDIFIKNADGTGTSRNISNEPGVLEIYPQWSPDGKQMVYTVYAGDNEKVPAAIKVADVEDPSHVRTILPADPSTGSSSVIKGFWLR